MVTTQVKEDVWVKTFCHGCLSAMCGMMVHRVNGVVVGLEGDPDNPYTHGKLCAKAYAHIMTLYDPNRPAKPLLRGNPEKGIGVDPKWKEVSWEEALDLAAKKLAEVRKSNPAGLCLSTADISGITWWPGPVLLSFGSPNWNSSAGYYCASAVHTVPFHTMGCFHLYPDFEYCNHLILWGSNKGGVIQHVGTTAAYDVAEGRLKRGMKLVCIDPVQSNMAAKADEWVPIRPGTDLAMALAWLHVLLNETGIYDAEHLKRYTNAPYLIKGDGRYLRDASSNKPLMWDPVDGVAKPYDAEFKDVAIKGSYQVEGIPCRPAFDLLREHVRGCTPEWASPITTVPSETIRRLAKEFGEAARIGSTIKYEGVVLPYRPATIHWYAGISQHVNGYVTGIALQLINTVVGNLLVPGGTVGEGTIMESFPYHTPNAWTGRDPTTGGMSEPGELDGLITPTFYTLFGGSYRTGGYPPTKPEPPKTHGVGELFPVSFMAMATGMAAFELAQLHPEVFKHQVPRPKVLLTRHGSDMTCHGNPQEVAQVLKNFYQISCEPLVDETAEFADVFLPVPTRLERLQLGSELPGYGGATINLQHQCINLSQPVVPPKGKEMMDIWGEIADRVGFRAEYNQMVNIVWDLQGEYRLEADKKYSYEEMQERFCKTLFGPEYDLKLLGEAGHLKWRKTVRERYPRVFVEGRAPIYYEHFLGAGEELGQILEETGIEWDLTDYKPLPSWRPGPAHRETRREFDLYAVPFRVPFLIHMWGTHNPWLTELAEHHPWAFKIIMNVSTGAEHAIKDGDHIVVEGATGYKVEGQVKLTQCIHPEVVALSRHGGHWAQRHPVSRGKGTHFNTLVPHTKEYIDPLFGGLEGCIRVKVARKA